MNDVNQHLDRKISLLIAVGLDFLVGDPPNRFHPVAWIGSTIAGLKQHRPFDDPAAELAYGAGIVAVSGLSFGAAGWVLHRGIQKLPRPLRWLAEGLALKTLFAVRGLDRAAGEVQDALAAGDLPEARRLVAWHLVSRDTSTLDESEVSAAAIESVAENASDSLVAPLFYYLIGGLPLALFYRVSNTADAMLGYRSEAYEWLGKVPARLDDLLNIVPARITAGLFTLAAGVAGLPIQRTLDTIRTDARKTDSPNAGYPMSAMAGTLGVKLEKKDHYTLGSGLRKPGTHDLQQARNILLLLTGCGVVLTLLIPGRRRRPSA